MFAAFPLQALIQCLSRGLGAAVLSGVACGLCASSLPRTDALQINDTSSLQDRFFAEYPAASQRLAGAVRQVQGLMKCKIDRISGPGEWTQVRFFKSGDNVRVDINPPSAGKTPTTRAQRGARSILIKPGEAAVVLNPQTERAELERIAAEPVLGDMALATIMCLRLVHGAYCYETFPLLDKIRAGSWSVRRVARDERDPERVLIEFDISDRTSSGQTDLKQTGRALITFSPRESWAIRGYDIEFTQPDALRTEGAIDAFESVADGYIPKSSHLVDYERPSGAPSWQEVTKIQYELVESNTDAIAESAFTLSALGVKESTKPARADWFITLLIAVVGACLVFYVLIRFRRRKLAGPGGS